MWESGKYCYSLDCLPRLAVMVLSHRADLTKTEGALRWLSKLPSDTLLSEAQYVHRWDLASTVRATLSLTVDLTQ